MTVPLPKLGTTTRIAGRATCASVPITNIPMAIIAPELPALTTASTSPRRISSKAIAIEESFLRSAALGDSCMGTTWDAADDIEFRRAAMLRQFSLDGIGLSDENQFARQNPERQATRPR